MDLTYANVVSSVAVFISVLLPLWLNSKNKRENFKKNTLERLYTLSLLINATPKERLEGIRGEVNIRLDYSGADIDFQIGICDCIENDQKLEAIKAISKYQNRIKL